MAKRKGGSGREERKGSSHVVELLGRQAPSLRAAPWLHGRLDPPKLGEQVRELTAWLLREHFLGAPLAAALPAGLREEVDAIVRRFESSALLRGVLHRNASLERLGDVLDAFVWLAALDLVRRLRTKFDEMDRQHGDEFGTWREKLRREPDPREATALRRVVLLQQPLVPGRPRTDPTASDLATVIALMAGDRLPREHVDMLAAGLANEFLGRDLQPTDVKALLWRHRRDEGRDRRARRREQPGFDWRRLRHWRGN